MAVEVVIILSIMSVFVTFLNLFCIAVITYTKRLHKASHMAISSLLLAHLIQGIAVIPSYAVKRAEVSRDHRICDAFRFTYFFTNYASCLSLLVISLDRCFGVVFPLKYKVFITPNRMIMGLCVVWAYIFGLSLIPFAPNDKTKCKYHPNKEWTLTMLLGHTMVPFIIILFCYTIIFGKVKKVLKVRKSQMNRSKMNLARHKQWNKSKTSVIIVAVYLFCWGPSFVYYTTLMLCPKGVCFTNAYLRSDAEQYVTFVMKLITFLDGVLAPLIYCFDNRSFSLARQKFIRNVKSNCLPMSCYDSDARAMTTSITTSNPYYTTTAVTEMSAVVGDDGPTSPIKDTNGMMSSRRKAFRRH